MKNKRILTCIIATLISLAALFSISVTKVRASGETIPIEYYQQLNLNGTYVYNVTAFGSTAGWYDFNWVNIANYSTNPGGKVLVNFTGFYNRDPADIFGDLMPDTNMPWMDIEIFKNGESTANFTRNNCSNSEPAGQLMLGYGDFKPGFLVPIHDFTELNRLAVLGSDYIYGAAFLTFEETKNILYFGFTQIGGGQITNLIYDKTTGLLIWASTSGFGFQLEMECLNYTLDYNEEFIYDVLKFNEPKAWYNLTGAMDGIFKTNPTGFININFTGDFAKDSNDLYNVFEDPIPWIDIDIIENNVGIFYTNFSLNNRSNSEAARELKLGFNNFSSGFRIPLNNISNIIKLATQQASGAINGNVNIFESNLTISFQFNSTSQNTTLVYEKHSGLLLSSNTTWSNYTLSISIRSNITSPYTPGPSPGMGEIIFLPYLIVVIASVAIVVPFEFGSRISSKTKKYALIAMLAVSGFSGLLFLNNNMNLLMGPTTFKQQVDNITVIVEYADGRDPFTSGPFSLYTGKTSLYDALDRWFDVELEYYSGLGYKLIAIDGYEPTGWVWTINGGAAGGITTTPLNSGDTIVFTAIK